jgi:hypothetical protein
VAKQLDKRSGYAARTAVNTVIEPLAEAAAEADKIMEDDATAELFSRHPDAKAILEQPEFQGWLHGQSPIVSKTFTEGGLEDADWLLNLWKNSPEYTALPTETSDGDVNHAETPVQSSSGVDGSDNEEAKPVSNSTRQTRLKRASASPGPASETIVDGVGGGNTEFEEEFNSLVAQDELRGKRTASM